MGLALYNKWRPMRFDDVVGQAHITKTLKTQAAQGRLSHAYFFCGPRGTGKTTCARILARAANCQHPVNGDPCNACPTCLGILDGSIPDVFELDAATYTGVSNIRDLRDEAVYAPASAKKKVYIIDEAHMLSTGAFNALLKILEEPPAHVMFVLASTELQKVPATILSRCQRFEFKRILRQEIAQRLMQVAKAENIPLAESGALTVAHLSDGAMRNALSLLEQASGQVSGQALDSDGVAKSLGIVTVGPLFECVRAIAQGDSARALAVFDQQYSDGVEPASFLERLLLLFRDLMICRAGEGNNLIGAGYTPDDLTRLLPLMTPEQLLFTVRTLRDAASAIGRSPNKRVDAEMALIALTKPALSGDYAALSARIAALETRIATGLPVVPASEAPAEVRKTSAPAPTISAPSVSAASAAAASAAPAKPAVPAVSASQPGGVTVCPFRAELISALRDNLDRMTFSYMKTCQFLCEDNRLRICAVDPMTYDMISQRGVLDAVNQTLASIGKSYRAVAEKSDGKPVPTGNAPAQAAPGGEDAFSSLLGFAGENPDIARIR